MELNNWLKQNKLLDFKSHLGFNILPFIYFTIFFVYKVTCQRTVWLLDRQCVFFFSVICNISFYFCSRTSKSFLIFQKLVVTLTFFCLFLQKRLFQHPWHRCKIQMNCKRRKPKWVSLPSHPHTVWLPQVHFLFSSFLFLFVINWYKKLHVPDRFMIL